ncbi:MAG: LysR family transcriptional regulator [Clostridiales bacterium]|nr:LysR family transcriptional regulator [Clostridiales bacterium]
MNLKEVKYIVKIAEAGNVSRAAEQLFITPSALTQQLLRLEDELGTPLFIRSRNGWKPTKAGEIYLETAREMLRMKSETYHRLQDIAKTWKGTLSVGLPPDRGAALFTSVYPAFSQEYPDIRIQTHEVTVRRQQQMIARGELDIGFLTLMEHQKTNDEYLYIKREEALIAIPSEHPACRDAVPSASSPFPELDIAKLQYEPFALIHKESTFRELADNVFRQAGFEPTLVFEATLLNTILSVAAAGLCCGLVPSFHAVNAPRSLSFFSLPEHPSWYLTASYRRKTRLSKPARRFIELATQQWRNELP